MAYWNHRIVKTSTEFEDYYHIEEVFYNKDGSIYGVTSGCSVGSDSIESVKELLQLMIKCLDKPVLIEDEIKFVDHEE